MSSFRVKNLEVTGSFLLNGSSFEGGGGGVDLTPYLTISSAISSYETISNAANTYLRIVDAPNTYATTSYVSSNYALSSSLSNYVTNSSLSTTLGNYATTSSLTSSFLTGRIGAGIYAAYGSIGGGGISNTEAISGGNAVGLSNQIGSYATNSIGNFGLNNFGYAAPFNWFGPGATINWFGVSVGSSQPSANYFGSGYATNYFGQNSTINRYYSGSGIGQFDFDTRLKVNGSGVALTGEVLTNSNASLYLTRTDAVTGYLPTGSGVQYLTTGNNIFIYATSNELSLLNNVNYTGSAYLLVNNLPLGTWMLETSEMYSGNSASAAFKSKITGQGVVYPNFANVQLHGSTFINTLGTTTTDSPTFNYIGAITGEIKGTDVLGCIKREGLIDVTSASSKIQVSFAQNAASPVKHTLLLSGSYLKLRKIL